MNLVYMSRPIYGGWVSFTSHLSLKNNYDVYKIGTRSEKSKRNFGYGVNYQNILFDDLLKKDNLMIVAIDKHNYDYLDKFPNNTKLVIHDPADVKNKKIIPHLSKFQIVTIRPLVKQYLLDKFNIESELMNHPFYRHPKNKESMNNYAVSISRIDYDKNIDIILKCNSILDNEDQKVKIFGKENRIYVHHELKGLNFNDYWYGRFKKDLPMIYNDKDILLGCKFVIDLSLIKNDGGGTQYTFLEAIYNDCVLILHNDWINKGSLFIDNFNCLSVKDEYELKDILNITKQFNREEIIRNARKILDDH